MTGYFDGNTCIPLDPKAFRPNQKVIITGLDEYIQPPRKHEQTVSSILKEITGILQSDKIVTAEDIRNERLEEKYGHSSRY